MSNKNQNAFELGLIGRSAYIVGSKHWTPEQKRAAIASQGEGAEETCNFVELRGTLENGQDIVLRGQLRESSGEGGGVSAQLNVMVRGEDGSLKGRVPLTSDLLVRDRTADAKKAPKSKTGQAPVAAEQFADVFGS